EATCGSCPGAVLGGEGPPAWAGRIAATPGGGFRVTASHTYAEAGSYLPVVRVFDKGGSAVDAGSAATAAVTPPGGLLARLTLLGNIGAAVPGNASPDVSQFAGGDVNGDGKLDLVARTAASTMPSGLAVEVAMGNGDGTYRTPSFYDPETGRGFVALFDLTGDGKLDIVTGGSVLLGNGDGTFQKARDFDARGNPAVVPGGGFNGGGKLHLGVGGRVPGPGTAPTPRLLGHGRRS